MSSRRREIPVSNVDDFLCIEGSTWLEAINSSMTGLPCTVVLGSSVKHAPVMRAPEAVVNYCSNRSDPFPGRVS